MIAIIDYGASNLRSVQKAFEYIGQEAQIVSDEKSIMSADRIVLPGNGAFGDCISALKSAGLISVIDRFIETERPFLGICMGMQLLFDKSLEFGVNEGFGYIKGVVRRFPQLVLEKGYKIPHTGWNYVKQIETHKLFNGIEDNTPFYFVHSYYADNYGGSNVIGACDYCGLFTAAVAKNNIMGVQFHPEKSQKAGLKLLENFCSL